MTQRYMYVFSDEGEVFDKGLVNITKDRYVDETPLEDYGNYLLTCKPTSTPWEDWMKGCQ